MFWLAQCCEKLPLENEENIIVTSGIHNQVRKWRSRDWTYKSKVPDIQKVTNLTIFKKTNEKDVPAKILDQDEGV